MRSARTFGSSLSVRNTVEVLVDKVGHVVTFRYLRVFTSTTRRKAMPRPRTLPAEMRRLLADAIVSHPGKGVTGFALANRCAVNQLHPSLDFAGLEIEREYRSMAALPLFKDEMVAGRPFGLFRPN